ncbi:S8 family serine peptidase, partial [Microvirga sp. 3-52]|nr:S8 family serine peptidase [Microvirga sp. 3-52]
MKRFVRAIPFQVNQQANEVNEVPSGIELIQAPKIWQETKGKGVTIAVLDTGCDIDHPNLKDRIIGGRNFTDDDAG